MCWPATEKERAGFSGPFLCPRNLLCSGHSKLCFALREIFSVTQNSSRKRGERRQTTKNRSGKKCVMVRFTDEEYARFLTTYEQSSLLSKAQFIKARVFDATFRVIKKDRGTMEELYKEDRIRAIGVSNFQSDASSTSAIRRKSGRW